jgi:hypothetical protein
MSNADTHDTCVEKKLELNLATLLLRLSSTYILFLLAAPFHGIQ